MSYSPPGHNIGITDIFVCLTGSFRRPKPNDSVNKNTLKTNNEDASRSPDLRNGNRLPNARDEPKASIAGLDTFISELTKINQSICDVKRQQHDDAQLLSGSIERINQRISSNQEENSAILHGIKNLHSLIEKKRFHGDDTTKSFEMLSSSVDDNLKVMAEKLQSSNTEHRESLLTLKVC